MSKRMLIKDMLWIIVFIGMVAAFVRFVFGLGQATGLNDASPWGLWIAFKLAFVALSGGGFTLAAFVYIFHIDRYRPIVRRAILMALLGYGSFVVSLLFDLGLPWRIYMPVIRWQYHSVMFEIAWCVMLYFTVLNLEFGAVILEHPWLQHPVFQWISDALHRSTIPIVIAGIVLSTLHQSSLGSLFLIMPFRVHPLWYSPLIPIFFFITAIGLGLMAVVLDGFISARLFGRKLHFNLLSQLGKIAGYVLWFYLILRLGDLAWRGIIPAGLDGSWPSLLFGVEIVLGGIVPATLLLLPRVRHSREGLITCGLLTTFGIVMQRMSLSMFTMRLPEGASYFPTVLEVAIAVAVPAAAGLLYFFFVENLAVLQPDVPPRQPRPYAKPQFSRGTYVHREDSFRHTVTRRSGLAVIAVALTVAILPAGVVTGGRPDDAPVKAALGWEILAINGNRNQNRVNFDHLVHQERLKTTAVQREEICSTCHHLNKPDDEATACWGCHQAMYRATSIFDHTFHQQALGGNSSCGACHNGEHTARTAAPCVECHEAMGPPPDQATFNHAAPGYQAAMHGACISCHQQEADVQNKPALARCSTCHQRDETEYVDVGEIGAARKLPDGP